MLQNLLIAAARAAASTVLGSAKSLVLHLEGLVGDTSSNEPMFGALGVVARPKLPVTSDSDVKSGLNPEGECEVLAIKNEDGMQPFAYRDLRLTARLPTIEEGDVFLSGYQGGYVAIRATTDNLGSTVTLRAPRLASDGTETLAHSLVLDPHASAAPAIALTHGSGYSIRITNAGDTEVRDKLVVSPDNSPQQVALFPDLNTYISQNNAYLAALALAVSSLGGSIAGTPPSAAPIGSSKLLTAP